MKKYLGVYLVVSLILGYFLFSEVLHYYFVSDDFVWLLQAKRDTLGNVFNYLFDSQGFFYRPFTKTYFFVMWQFFGANPYPYHLVNVFLHYANSLIVFLLSFVLLKSVFKEKSERVLALLSFGSALLFFIHPVHQENIIWISAVTELYPAFFVFSALLLFLTTFDKNWFSKGIFYLCFILALMSHEYSVIFPALVILTDFFVVKRSLRQLLIERKFFYGSLIIVDVLYVFIRARANSHWSGGDYSYNLVKLPFNFIGNIVGYVGLNIIGIPFISIYQNMRSIMRENIGLATILLLIVAIGILLIGRIVKRNYAEDSMDSRELTFLFYLVLFFVCALLPFLGLGGIAERYLYLPSFAFLLVLSLFLYWIIRYFDIPVRSYRVWYLGLLILIGGLYFYSAKNDQSDWKLASSFVEGRLQEFKDNCAQFKVGESLSRVSPPNRQGRAWVFQVGYEQGANVLCDKKMTILLK